MERSAQQLLATSSEPLSRHEPYAEEGLLKRRNLQFRFENRVSTYSELQPEYETALWDLLYPPYKPLPGDFILRKAHLSATTATSDSSLIIDVLRARRGRKMYGRANRP